MSKIGGEIALIIQKNTIHEKLANNNLYTFSEHMIIKCTINHINFIIIFINRLHKISLPISMNCYTRILDHIKKNFFHWRF